MCSIAYTKQKTAWGEEGERGELFFSPAVLMYYASYCSAYFKGLLDMMYIYKTKMVLSACSCLYFLVEVSMNACEDHTPSAKCGGWLPRARGRKGGRRRGDAGLQEGCVCERKAFAHIRRRQKWASPRLWQAGSYTLPNFKRGVFAYVPVSVIHHWPPPSWQSQP